MIVLLLRKGCLPWVSFLFLGFRLSGKWSGGLDAPVGLGAESQLHGFAAAQPVARLFQALQGLESRAASEDVGRRCRAVPGTLVTARWERAVCAWLGLHQPCDPSRDPRDRLRGLRVLAHGPTGAAVAWTSPSCASQPEESRGEALNGGQRWWHLEDSVSPSQGGLSLLQSSVHPHCCLCLSHSRAAGASSLSSLGSLWLCPAGQSRQDTGISGLQREALEQWWAEKLERLSVWMNAENFSYLWVSSYCSC